ncbi:2904_t:CDS:1, partial [Scutellospora calospora]
HVRLEFEINTSKDNELAMKDMVSTSTAYIQPNRVKKDQRFRTLSGVSNWREWQ